MSRLNESIVEAAALEWCGEQFRFAQTLTPALSQGEREKREAIRRLNPANACGDPHPASPKGRGEEGRATHKEPLSVQIERRPIP
jgi:hypothetical protein